MTTTLKLRAILDMIDRHHADVSEMAATAKEIANNREVIIHALNGMGITLAESNAMVAKTKLRVTWPAVEPEPANAVEAPITEQPPAPQSDQEKLNIPTNLRRTA